MEVLLFGGTSEGRTLAEWLGGAGIPTTLCVATQYGAALMPPVEGVQTVTGRLDSEGMCGLMRLRPFTCVVDATHPYAVEVTQNIRSAAQHSGLPCHRLVRDGDVEGEWLRAADMEEAAQMVGGLPGNVLLTTGSKELAAFAGLRARCYPRILPSLASLTHTLELGFPPSHVLCMQGPFSKELNLAMLEQYAIKVLVTKSSGGAGGFWDKVAAARAWGCALLVIARPTHEQGLHLAEIKEFLKGEAQ